MRRLIRLDAALTALFLQLVMLVGLSAAIIVSAYVLPQMIRYWDDPHLAQAKWVALLMFMLVLPLVGGMWIGSALSHWRPLRALIAWAVLLLAPLLVTGTVISLDETRLSVMHIALDERGAEFLRTFLMTFPYFVGRALILVTLTFALMIPAMRVGWIPLSIADSFRRYRWRWRRRRARLRGALS